LRAAAVAAELLPLYRRAAAETASGSKSFYFATQFFPPEVAKSAYAVYWFCRHTDDLVDECATVQQGREDLEEWAAALDAASRSGAAAHPVLRVFLDTARRHEIDLQYAFELIEGMRMDLNQTRYETFEELRVFCYRVASVVGLMMCQVIGFAGAGERERALPHAIELGIAMQLTNILRDVGEDLARQRIYIPADDMRRFGYSEGALRRRSRSEAFKQLMTFQAARARAFYQRGNAGIAMLDRRGRFAVKVASDVYREILSQVEDSDFDVFERRAVVPRVRKYWLTARNMAGPMARHSAQRLAFWRSGL
jgi:phytoene synthase